LNYFKIKCKWRALKCNYNFNEEIKKMRFQKDLAGQDLFRTISIPSPYHLHIFFAPSPVQFASAEAKKCEALVEMVIRKYYRFVVQTTY